MYDKSDFIVPGMRVEGATIKVQRSAALDAADQRVSNVIEALRSFCHAQECENPFQCPQTHTLCRGGLGLDTAIAWEASHALYAGLDAVYRLYKTKFRDEDNLGRNFLIAIRTLEDARAVLDFSIGVLMLHKDTNNDLIDMLDDSIGRIMDLRGCLVKVLVDLRLDERYL